ncbi:hypothetical protein F4802DRAFT_600573 [Xylaria palmicola]|nr:hypothetical protein F4802DRAFT_600573 [Xylaria palmicola]
MAAMIINTSMAILISFTPRPIVNFIIAQYQRTIDRRPWRAKKETDEDEPKHEVAYEMQPMGNSQLGEPYQPRCQHPQEYRRTLLITWIDCAAYKLFGAQRYNDLDAKQTL